MMDCRIKSGNDVAEFKPGKICRVIMVNKTFLPMPRRAAPASNSL
jgi:hypothetical protein